MGMTSLQACMDSADWLQGTLAEDAGIDSSSSPNSADMLTCSRAPLMERRLRPQHDQALKCPRCDSTHTKFCYYNNYSLTQPRYFCKTCRRYWTKGGTLRNVPVGGGCRKNKKPSSSKKPSASSSSSSTAATNIHDQHSIVNLNPLTLSSSLSPIELHLSFPGREVQLSHISSLLGANGSLCCTNSFMENNYNNPIPMLENINGTQRQASIGFLGSKLEDMVGDSIIDAAARSHEYEFVGNESHFGIVGGGIGHLDHHGSANNNISGGLCPPFCHASIDGNYNSTSAIVMENFQRLMLPYHDHGNDQDDGAPIDVKPNTKQFLTPEWQDQAVGNCPTPMTPTEYPTGRDSFGYHVSRLAASMNIGGMINGYGQSSTNNPLI